MRYLFGDTDLAAERLKVLAEVFAPCSRGLLEDWGGGEVELGVDLGCGPGCTTHMLAETTGCARTVGLDRSEHFLNLARGTATDRVGFELHDVTAPFPVGPADRVYCRFLLTHLADPAAAVARWATQLRPGGRMLLEEVDWIRTENGTFRTYLGIVEAMLADRSCTLNVGPVLDGLPTPEGLRRCDSRVGELPVATADAATMFHLNFQTWKDNPFVRTHYSPVLLHQVEDMLHLLAAGADQQPTIEWGLRQMVYERL